ncbi:MAG TPA: 50S ribosomal protein L3 [Polyangiaceae bacterium]|nr:50S ribosomal protein L3 [Polyangiaceae bacterium]
MNKNPGVIGRKIGMSQVIEEDGTVVPVTVIEAAATVVAKRTQEKDGYDAIVVGIGERKAKHTNKPLAGFYAKAGVSPKRELRELRCTAEEAAAVEIGSQLALDSIFQVGQFVDVQSTSKGKGFQGVMKRHNFAGSPGSHGTHEYRRHGGSVGTNMTPGRVLPGRKMPGQMGNKTSSVLSQKVIRVIPEDNLVLVRGGVPGHKETLVIVRGAIKKKNGGKVS